MAIIASYDWESDTFTHHNGDNPARTAWRDAVAEVTEKAKAALPECNGRVESAAKIVLSGDVELLDDGKAKVASQSNGTTTYHVVNGECSCKDFPKAPSNWCKHRIASGIQKRASALAKTKLEQLDSVSNGANQPPAEQPQAEPQEPQGETVSPLPEAPVSITLKATLHGHEVLVTLRGTDFASVKAQVEEASQWLQAHSPAQPESPSCPIHKVPLTKNQKNGKTWYSHKTADGWCKGR